jgi:hypothetical protein
VLMLTALCECNAGQAVKNAGKPHHDHAIDVHDRLLFCRGSTNVDFGLFRSPLCAAVAVL